MGEGNCRVCKDWWECKGKEWFGYQEIRWCPFQQLWILRHSSILNAGQWPPEPLSAMDQHRINPEAYFVKAKITITETKERLAALPEVFADVLLSQVEAGKMLEDLRPSAYDALIYISGSSRRQMDFYSWRRQRKYRGTTTKTYSTATA